MLNRNKSQPTDNWHIVVANAKGVVNYIGSFLEKDTVTDAQIGAFMLFASPLMLLGSLVKTAFDIFSRKKCLCQR